MHLITRRRLHDLMTILVLTAVARTPAAHAQDPSADPRPAPPRAEGEGPFERMVIRNATVIDGTGAPPRGPVDIVVERNRITAVVAVGPTAGDMRRAEGPSRPRRKSTPRACRSCLDSFGITRLPMPEFPADRE